MTHNESSGTHCYLYDNKMYHHQSKQFEGTGIYTETLGIKEDSLSPGAGSSPKEVLAEGPPKNCSLRRDSGTGLTMNLRPAECTTWAVVLGEIPERKIKKQVRYETESDLTIKKWTVNAVLG